MVYEFSILVFDTVFSKSSLGTIGIKTIYNINSCALNVNFRHQGLSKPQIRYSERDVSL